LYNNNSDGVTESVLPTALRNRKDDEALLLGLVVAVAVQGTADTE